MKKVFVISVLTIFLFSNTELHQLLHLPVLFHHFIDHKKIDDTISFVEFFKKHYTEKSNNTAHDHNNEHKHLPFKSNDCGTVHSVVSLFEFPSFNFSYQHFISDKEKIIYRKFFHSSVCLSNIWQPPKTT